MQTVKTSAPTSQTNTVEPIKQTGIYWPAVAVFAFFLGFFCLWASLDHTTATWDGAGHALRGYQCADILQAHTHFKHKLHDLFTVNSFYPPFTYFVLGAMHLCLPDAGAFVDGFSRFLWYGLAGLALYRMAVVLLHDRAVGALAAATFYLYPGVYGVSHSIVLLDLPLTAMIFVGLWRLAVWNEQRNWRQAIGLGLVLGCAFLTKQSAMMFFAVPLAVLFVQSCRGRRWAEAAMLVVCGLLAGALFLCWAIPNYEAFKQFVSQNQTVMHETNLLSLWGRNLWLYLYLSATALSPLGALLFVGSLFNANAQRRLWLLGITAGGALLFHVVLNWIPQFRYILPLTCYTSLLTAAMIVGLWRARGPKVRSALVLAGTYAAYVFFVLNLAPYFLPVSHSVERATGISVMRKAYSPSLKPEPCAPTPAEGDWGYDWTFNIIERNDGTEKSTLCVLPDLAELNTPGFMYYARVRRSPVQFTTYRLWSMVGYDFIDPPNLPWVRWFLVLQNCDQKAGREFATAQATQRYQNLVNLLKTDKAFVLAGSMKIPHGGDLLLYRNTATDKRAQ